MEYSNWFGLGLWVELPDDERPLSAENLCLGPARSVELLSEMADLFLELELELGGKVRRLRLEVG